MPSTFDYRLLTPMPRTLNGTMSVIWMTTQWVEISRSIVSKISEFYNPRVAARRTRQRGVIIPRQRLSLSGFSPWINLTNVSVTLTFVLCSCVVLFNHRSVKVMITGFCPHFLQGLPEHQGSSTALHRPHHPVIFSATYSPPSSPTMSPKPDGCCWFRQSGAVAGFCLLYPYSFHSQ